MNTKTDGSTAIYGEWAELYEQFDGEAGRATWRAGIVLELCRLGASGASRVLDIGAGTGIGRRELSEAFPGCTVVSLDQSEAMLRRGRIPPALRIVGDMSSFELHGSPDFDFVVSGFDALNYLDRESLGSCFASVAPALRAGGHLVFDYSSRKLLKHDWGHLDVVSESEGLRLSRAHRYEEELERTRIQLVLETDARVRWSETHYHYSVDPFDMAELAFRAGLEVTRARDIESESFCPWSATHVYILRRVAEEDEGTTAGMSPST